ncbi:hypothetical protein LJR074_005199 [Acidovorax sp. LjRoot74]|uniref:hypothetical protein n=1 Tax=Acidovorax sp. LjRoot74 TaxID=3342337 RepID=UPI003ECD394E
MKRAALCALRGGGVLARVALAALVVQLAGCALPAREQPGALRAEVLARLGPPSATFALASGERLLYSELPAGFEAHALDFDASGRLLRNEQVLTQARFENLPIGAWTRADVERTFGAPLRVERVARFDGDIWTYRFRQNSDLRLAHVHLDRQGMVQKVLFTDELPHLDNARD